MTINGWNFRNLELISFFNYELVLCIINSFNGCPLETALWAGVSRHFQCAVCARKYRRQISPNWHLWFLWPDRDTDSQFWVYIIFYSFTNDKIALCLVIGSILLGIVRQSQIYHDGKLRYSFIFVFQVLFIFLVRYEVSSACAAILAPGQQTTHGRDITGSPGDFYRCSDHLPREDARKTPQNCALVH